MKSTLIRTYRRLRFGQPIVVVSGLPRSGTSMTMKMLEAGGMTLVSDGLRTADEDNPKGYYEDERVKDLDKTGDNAWVADARGKAIKVISFLLRDLPLSFNYKVLFMGRDIGEVLASQQRMLERRGERSETEDDQMVEHYANHLWRVNFMMKRAPHIDVLHLEYTAVLENAADQAHRVRQFLDLPLDLERMASVVDESLYRNRRRAQG